MKNAPARPYLSLAPLFECFYHSHHHQQLSLPASVIMFRENETKSNKKDKIQKYLNQKGFLPVKSNFKCPDLHSEDINIQKKCISKTDAPKRLNGTTNQSGTTGGIVWGPYQGSLAHLEASGGLRSQI